MIMSVHLTAINICDINEYLLQPASVRVHLIKNSLRILIPLSAAEVAIEVLPVMVMGKTQRVAKQITPLMEMARTGIQ